jgi:hypothetical protein
MVSGGGLCESGAALGGEAVFLGAAVGRTRKGLAQPSRSKKRVEEGLTKMLAVSQPHSLLKLSSRLRDCCRLQELSDLGGDLGGDFT